MKKPNFDQMVAVYLQGDTRAFDAIYEATNRTLYFRILYVVGDKQAAQDILHDTYLQAMTHLQSYRTGTNFMAWLSQIGRNLSLNHIKKRQREVLTDFADDFRYGTQEQECPYVFDLARRVLSEEEYQIVMLCQVAGYKRREVAQKLDMPLSTVTWKNNQALHKLQQHLQEDGQ